jgi:molybdopterin-guanine dinucleotide biosynthesis protein A
LKLKPLYGLVVCGGQSLRMGVDKSLLTYYHLPQRYYLYQLLEKYCDAVFISCNKTQVASIDDFYNFIVDKPTYSEIGPMAALLSAYELFKDVSFLVIGCDYPLINESDIKKLIINRSQEKDAVCYYDMENAIEQPLLAIYENQGLIKLIQKFESRQYSLRAFLSGGKIEKIVPDSDEKMISIDTTEEYEWALTKIKGHSEFK